MVFEHAHLAYRTMNASSENSMLPEHQVRSRTIIANSSQKVPSLRLLVGALLQKRLLVDGEARPQVACS